MNILSEKLCGIKASPTFALVKKVAELRAAGKEIISLTVGEPDFDTPENVQNAAITAIRAGKNKYTAVEGCIEVKKAVQEKFRREQDIPYALNEIIVSTGGKQVIYNGFMASLNADDEVIIPAPYWVSYPDMIKISGGSPVIVHTSADNKFKITKSELENAITDKTKWIIINSPNNPTGSVYSPEELRDIADVLLQHEHVYVLSDDIYEHIIFNNVKFQNIVNIEPRLKDRALIVNGVSKAYAMTGWRLGYGAGPANLIQAMSIVQSQSTSGASSISQFAAVEALLGKQDFVNSIASIYERRCDIAASILSTIDGLNILKPDGAFYLFISCKGLIGKSTTKGAIITDDVTFAQYLLEDKAVAVMPSEGFGISGYFRISVALGEDDIRKATLLIKEFCLSLK